MVLIQVNYLMLHGQCIKMCTSKKRKETTGKKQTGNYSNYKQKQQKILTPREESCNKGRGSGPPSSLGRLGTNQYRNYKININTGSGRMFR